jgi:hypothetical protein
MSVVVEGDGGPADGGPLCTGQAAARGPLAGAGVGPGGAGVEVQAVRAELVPEHGPGGPQGGSRGVSPVPSEITFLYRLVPGHVAPSFGLYCAKLAGVQQVCALLRVSHVCRHGLADE